MSATNVEAPRQEKSILQISLLSMAGTTIEYYDFLVYGLAAALVFPALFFPESDPIVGTIAAFSTFTVGFVARLVGGAVFGHIGDKIGRKRALVIALVLMGAATTLIGLLPTYATIGVAAPVILVALRFLQGLALGGQWSGAVLIATESAPPNRRGFYGSFAMAGIGASLIIANGVFLVLFALISPEQFAAWGWRVPFLLSVVLIGIAFFMQSRLEETVAFQRVKEASAEARMPLVEVLTTYPKQVVLAGGTILATGVVFYIYAAYVVSYATTVTGISRSAMLLGVILAGAIMAAALLAFSALSDRVGRRKVCMMGAALSGVWAFPVFWLIDTGSVTLTWIAVALGLFFLAPLYGPQGALLSEMFGTRVRYSGASVGYQLGSVLGSGLAPVVAAALFAATGTSLSISVYVAAMCAISFVSLFLVSETARQDIREEQDQGSRAVHEGSRGSSTAT